MAEILEVPEVVANRLSDRRDSVMVSIDVSRLLHRYFMLLLFAAYVLAAFCPGLGLWIRTLSFGAADSGGHVSLSLLMLAFLLFNAGLGLDQRHVSRLLHRPWIPLVALMANLLVPLGIVLGLQLVSAATGLTGLTSILIGLTLVAAMPIANSSTAWAQNTNANIAISLGLVFCTTLLTPFTTPLILKLVGQFLEAGDRTALIGLADSFSGQFVLLWVIFPALLGMAVRQSIGHDRAVRIRPQLKNANAINLLLLNYTHGSAFLPRVIAEYDLGYLTMILLMSVLFCLATFSAGWLIGGPLCADLAERKSVMFALGMNNNGMALVLAAFFMNDFPAVSLTVVFCTFAQHLVAGGSMMWLNSRPDVDTHGTDATKNVTAWPAHVPESAAAGDPVEACSRPQADKKPVL